MGWGRIFGWRFLGMAGADRSLSVTLQLWLIGALAPIGLMFIGEFGRFDFNSLWIAGKMVLAGSANQIYDSNLSQDFASRLGLTGEVNFPYPPLALPFFLPFALIPRIPAYFAWNLTTALFFYWAAKPYLPKGFPPILILLTPAALTCLDYGQTGLLFGGFWLLAFNGRWPALTLLSVKPHLGFLGILAVRDWRNLAKAILFGAILTVVTMALWGSSLWIDFLGHTFGHATEMGTVIRKRWLFQGVSPAMGYGMLGWVPFAAAGALLLARKINAFTTATASFLISPYSFHYDMTVASLGFGLMIFSSWSEMPVKHRIPMVLGFFAPAIALLGVWWVPPILMWGLWAQTHYPSIGDLRDDGHPDESPLAAYR